MVSVGGSEVVVVLGRTEERQFGDTGEKEKRIVITVCSVHHSLHQPLIIWNKDYDIRQAN